MSKKPAKDNQEWNIQPPDHYFLAVEAKTWEDWSPEARYVVLLECFGIGYQYVRLLQDDDKYIVFYLIIY